MKLTKTSAHAALAMTFLARQSNAGLTQARQVAAHLGIPTDSALKILQTLARQGLIQSQLGRSGGYHMHREPQAITLLEVVEVIDGPIQAQLPIHGAREEVMEDLGELRTVYEQAAVQVRMALARVSIATLAHNGSQPVLSTAG